MSSVNSATLFRNRSFVALLLAQLLGFLNDNILKMMVSLLAVASVGAGEGAGVLSLVNIVFLVPYLLFSGYAGYLADKFGNRPTLVAAKIAELLIVVLAVGALQLGRIEVLPAVLFLLAAQATFFSPAKYSMVHDIAPAAHLQRANGLLEMSRFGAIIVGTALGGLILQAQALHAGVTGAVLLGIAVAGLAATLCIQPKGAPITTKQLRLNPWAEIGGGVAIIARNSKLWPAVIGLCCFEAMGALLLLDTILIGRQALGLAAAATSQLGAFVGIGLAIGSLLAWRCARRCVDFGLVPLGATAVGLILIATASFAHNFLAVAAALLLAGLCGAFCLVPLNAALQHYAHAGERGTVIATNNFLSMAAVLAMSIGLWLFQTAATIDPWTVLMMCGAAALCWAALMVCRFPGYGGSALVCGRRLLRMMAKSKLLPRAAALVLALALGAASMQRAEAATSSDPTTQLYRVTHSMFGEIGRFSQTIRAEGNQVVVESELNVRVTMLFSAIVLHEVRSSMREVWGGGKLIAYDSVTHTDGTVTALHGWAQPGSFAVSGPGGDTILPADVSPLSPWSISLTRARLLISPETGLPRQVAVAAATAQRLDLGNRTVIARHFVARGDEAFELWYDEHDQPVKLTIEAGIGTVSFLRR